MIEVIDNFLDKSFIDYISDSVGNINWRYRENISNNETYAPWLHGFYKTIHDRHNGITFSTNKDEIFIPFILKIEETFGVKGSLIRSRLDLTLRSPENTIHTPHKDYEYSHYACILYCNDSDGDTLIYNEKTKQDYYTIQEKISPKKNRLVFFDGDFYHTGHSPSNSNYRMIINSNFSK